MGYIARVMPRFIQTVLLLVVLTTAHSGAQQPIADDNFSVTVERIGCLGPCPDYEVKIFADGRVRYKGRLYVKVEGVRERKISQTDIKKLRRRLQEVRFFDWKETDEVCVDLPVVHITAVAGKQRKHVFEGCDSTARIPVLADEIEMIVGSKRWVGTPYKTN